jgi:hypothetical protein
VAADSSTTLVFAIGSSVVVVRATGPAALGETPMQLSFRDAATGVVRAQVTTPVHTGRRVGHDGLYDVWADSWAGRPALVVRHQIVEPSDGLSAEKRTDVVDVYGEDGAKRGSVSRPQSEPGFTVVNGWVVSEKPGGTYAQVTVADMDGRVRKTVSCSSLLCAVGVDIAETPFIQVGSSRVPLVMGDLVFEPQEISGRSSGINPLRLVATDLTSGKEAWSTATMPRPGEATDESSLTGAHAMPLAAFDDKLLMSWYTDRGSGFGERGEILALHDRASGKLLLTGPEMPHGTGRVIFDHAKQIAVVADAGSKPHSRAWDVRDGRTLWTQRDDEKPLDGQVIAAGYLYAYTSSDSLGGPPALIVVDVRTKMVKPEAALPDQLPIVTSTGHVAVVTKEGVFIFSPA